MRSSSTSVDCAFAVAARHASGKSSPPQHRVAALKTVDVQIIAPQLARIRVPARSMHGRPRVPPVMTFFLVRREDMGALLEVRKAYVDGVRPAVTTVFVAGLVQPDWLVEIEAVACAE